MSVIDVYSNTTAKNFVKYFTEKGLTNAGIQGLGGNIIKESNFKVNNLQNSYEKKWNVTDESYTLNVDHGTWKSPEGLPFELDKGGYGLCQWTSSGRKKALLDLAKSTGLSVGDEKLQFMHLYNELSTSYKSVLTVLTDPSKTVEDCALAVLLKFEKPAKKDEPSTQQARIKAAKDFGETFMQNTTPKTSNAPVIAINAGHWYGNRSRQVPAYMPVLGGTSEFELNNRVVLKVLKLLENYICEIVRVDDPTGLTAIELKDRVKMAENIRANIYLSIHHNGGIKGGKGGGTTVLYYKGTGKGETFNRNKADATSVYNEIKARTGLVGNRSTPVHATNDYYELNVPTMDSYIIECGFMDSAVDIYYIQKERWSSDVANGIVAFLVKKYNLVKKDETVETVIEDTPVTPTKPNPNSFKVKVEINNLRVRKGPSIFNEVTLYPIPQGIYTVVETNGKWGRLKSGIGWIHLDYVKRV